MKSCPALRRLKGLAWLAILPVSAPAQLPDYHYTTPYSITTLAGTTSAGADDGADPRFYQPSGVVIDSAGNLYVTDSGNQTIRKRNSAGVVSTLAGAATQFGIVDGNGAAARFTTPTGIAMDRVGNLYVTDADNHTIRKITPDGVVSTLAGNARNRGSADGVGTAARFNRPFGVAVDATGTVYVADTGNYTVRKISSDGTVTTLAGSAGVSGSTDGIGVAARFGSLEGIAVDAVGNLYLADASNHVVRKITPSGECSTLAGLAGSPGHVDGTGSAARFVYPAAVAVDAGGQLFVTCRNHTLRKITPAGSVSTLAGTPDASGSVDDTGASARFYLPRGITTDSAGNLYLADWVNNTVRKVTSGGTVSTVAGLSGPGTEGYLDGTGNAARFKRPYNAAVDRDGNLYVADQGNHLIRKITPQGMVSTFAGSPGVYGFSDGVGTSASFSLPSGIALDTAGNLYVADAGYSIIRKITPSGTVTTLAGSAGKVGLVDGSGVEARFNNPLGLAVDGEGTLYVLDRANQAVRKISPAGVVSTLFSNASVTDPASMLQSPTSLAVDQTGNVYVCDFARSLIFKITPGGAIAPFAGLSGSPGFNDGTGTGARFYYPNGIATDGNGNVYVAELGVGLIRRISPAGVVTTLAGSIFNGGRMDGVGPSSGFDNPFGITTDLAGNIYVIDSGSVRKGRLAAAPVVTTQPQNQTVPAGGNVSFNVAATGSPDPTYQWYFNGNPFSGATGSSLSFSNARASDAGDYTVVVTNSLGSVTSAKATLTVSSGSSSSGSGGSSGGGGGMPSLWFVLTLMLLTVTKKKPSPSA